MYEFVSLEELELQTNQKKKTKLQGERKEKRPNRCVHY